MTVADDDLQLYNFTGSKNFNTYIFTVTYTTALAKLSGTIFFTMYKEAIADKINNNQVTMNNCMTKL